LVLFFISGLLCCAIFVGIPQAWLLPQSRLEDGIGDSFAFGSYSGSQRIL